MTALLCGSSQTHLGTSMPSGGGHIINARQHNKDMQNLGKFVRELGLDLPLIETAIERYRRFHAKGNELADSASISRLYDALTPAE